MKLDKATSKKAIVTAIAAAHTEMKNIAVAIVPAGKEETEDAMMRPCPRLEFRM